MHVGDVYFILCHDISTVREAHNPVSTHCTWFTSTFNTEHCTTRFLLFFKASSGMINSQFPGILSSIVCRTILNQNGTKCTLHSVLLPQSTQDNLFDIVNSIPPDRVAVIEWAILPWNHFRKRTNLPMMSGLGLFFHESPSSEHIYLNTSSRREIV